MQNFEYWCGEVLRCVRFKADHAAIRKELSAHYEDHVKDLQRIGYDENLAKTRALAAMGDAEEVGRGLDQAHKPWLGRLWQVSRIVLVLTAMFAVAFMYDYQTEGMLRKIRLEPQPYFENVASMTDLPRPRSFESGIYTYTFQHAEYAWDGWGNVNICMNAYTPYFWMKGPDLSFLTATDSLGRTYTGFGKHNIYGLSDGGRVNIGCAIEISTGAEWPEWLEITHATAGWSFRIELPQEGGTP